MVDIPSWKVAFTDEITAIQHLVDFYRSTALLLLSIFILIPGIFLYFFQDNMWVLISGVSYTLLAFFLVESYNQVDIDKEANSVVVRIDLMVRNLYSLWIELKSTRLMNPPLERYSDSALAVD